LTLTAQRKHSKFSASGAERWSQCSASVEASEGQPDRTTQWAEEGTQAHSVLERLLNLSINAKAIAPESGEMFRHALNAARFILWVWSKHPGSDIMVETRIWLQFIHPAMFGTFDGAVVDHFGTLHVFDFKYGAGHAVAPNENLQMIFYAIGLAHKHHWNFSKVRMWIIQPRIKGYDGPTYWEISIEQLRTYVEFFKEAVWRVENKPEFKEGSWCHWCKAKSVCPLKQEGRLETAQNLFTQTPLGGKNERTLKKIESKAKVKTGQESPRQKGKGGKGQKIGKEVSKESRPNKSARVDSGREPGDGDFY
jgi:hypothetical protein